MAGFKFELKVAVARDKNVALASMVPNSAAIQNLEDPVQRNGDAKTPLSSLS